MKLAVLAVLYLVEGLPYGLQTQALPLFLREGGMSRAAISALGLVAVPWMLKPLWSPLVDRFGTRRRWILVMLLLMAVAAASGRLALVPALLALNLCAATLDIAVDGLAVDLLGRGELGLGNTAQVVGYKAGMFLGGGILGSFTARAGLGALFAAVAATIAFVLVAITLAPLPERARAPERDRVADIVRTLGRAIATPTGAWVIACVATYKLGESLCDPMFKLYVRDAGFPLQTVLTWTAIYGLIASAAGSLAGGVLASKVAFRRALFVAAAFRLGPLVAQWLIASRPPAADAIVAVICAENFFGGALTTVMFAFMMAQVDRRIGATHYTVLAGIEVLGKAPTSYLSGLVADRFGYVTTFATGALLSAAYLALLAAGPRAELDRA